MNSNALVSIIIPCYNSENSIAQCLDSILQQSYNTIQVILIDDGSSDQTLAICKTYAAQDERIEVFHQKNAGVSSARNKGLDCAKGKYVLFVDSDDYIYPFALEELLAVQPIADLTFFSCSFVHKGEKKTYILNDKYIDDIHQLPKGIINVKSYFKDIEYFGYTWNKLLLNDIIQTYHIRFIPNLSYREDEIFTLEYYTHCKTLRESSIILYNYMVHRQGLTTSQTNSRQFLLYLDNAIPHIRKIHYTDLYKYEVQRIFYLCIYAAKLARKEKRIKIHHLLIKKAYNLYINEIKPKHIDIRKVYQHTSLPLFYLNAILHYRNK